MSKDDLSIAVPDTAPATSLRPWQFFALAALISATVAVFVARGTTPSNVILICLTIGAAGLVGLAAYRTLWPLVSSEGLETEMIGSRTRVALEREKSLALRSIKELEFDRAMGKLSEADYEEMVARLRSRAARLLKQLDAGGTGYRELIERELASRLVKSGSFTRAIQTQPPEVEESARETTSTCSSCGTVNDPDARFCKQCGTKLVALLLAMLCFAAPGWAQVQMPDPRQMAGIPRPVDDLPDGTISVRLIRGQLSNNIPNHPVELHAGDQVLTAKTDENGRAEFRALAPGAKVKAAAVVEGERLESQEFPAPGRGGIRLLLVATVKEAEGRPAAAPQPAQPGTVALGGETRFIIDLSDDGVQIYYLLDIVNGARAPVTPPAPVILDMPTGAQGTSILEGSSPQALARGNRVTVTGPFQPGRTAVDVGYQMPYSGGTVSLSQRLPVSLQNVTVLMKKVGDMNLISPQLSARQERQLEGQTYILAEGPAVSAGGNVTMELSGLPHHNPVPRRIAFVLVGLVFVVGLWAAFSVRPQGADAARVKQLKARREKVFSDLIRVEDQRRGGKIDVSRYAARRAALVAQLERIYSELDAEGGDEGLAA